jgi:cell division septation protein DedD
MTAKAIPQSAASLRRDSRSLPRSTEIGARPVKRSFFSHPALLGILAAGCLALAVPYSVPYIRSFAPQILAFASSVTLVPRADTAVSPAPDAARSDVGFTVAAAAARPPARAASAAAAVPPAPGAAAALAAAKPPVPDATAALAAAKPPVPDAAAALAAAKPQAPKDALQVVQSSFDPVLLERLEVAAPETVADVIMGSEGSPVVTAEQLRILAQMTPEQIDALTFLILSVQDPTTAAATVDQTNAVADDAPWVGDWTAGDLGAESAAPSAAVEPPQNDLLKGWYVFEASADEAVIRHIDDPLSAVRVSPGTVLGNLGLVSEIKVDSGRAKVVLSGGDVILSDDSAVILAEDAASAPEQTEQRRGPPFEIALAAAQNKPQATSEAVASDAVVSDAVASGDATTPVLDPPPAVTKQTTSTKADPKQPAAQSGAGAGRYVQVATFKSVANAQIAKNMVMSDGMTGQLRTTKQQGASFHRVLAGPFDPAEIQKALTRVTRLGFKDAFIIR